MLFTHDFECQNLSCGARSIGVTHTKAETVLCHVCGCQMTQLFTACANMIGLPHDNEIDLDDESYDNQVKAMRLHLKNADAKGELNDPFYKGLKPEDFIIEDDVRTGFEAEIDQEERIQQQLEHHTEEMLMKLQQDDINRAMNNKDEKGRAEVFKNLQGQASSDGSEKVPVALEKNLGPMKVKESA